MKKNEVLTGLAIDYPFEPIQELLKKWPEYDSSPTPAPLTAERNLRKANLLAHSDRLQAYIYKYGHDIRNRLMEGRLVTLIPGFQLLLNHFFLGNYSTNERIKNDDGKLVTNRTIYPLWLFCAYDPLMEKFYISIYKNLDTAPYDFVTEYLEPLYRKYCPWGSPFEGKKVRPDNQKHYPKIWHIITPEGKPWTETDYGELIAKPWENTLNRLGIIQIKTKNNMNDYFMVLELLFDEIRTIIKKNRSKITSLKSIQTIIDRYLKIINSRNSTIIHNKFANKIIEELWNVDPWNASIHASRNELVLNFEDREYKIYRTSQGFSTWYESTRRWRSSSSIEKLPFLKDGLGENINGTVKLKFDGIIDVDVSKNLIENHFYNDQLLILRGKWKHPKDASIIDTPLVIRNEEVMLPVECWADVLFFITNPNRRTLDNLLAEREKLPDDKTAFSEIKKLETDFNIFIPTTEGEKDPP